MEQAYYLREELSDIFDEDYTKLEAQQAIQAWCGRSHQHLSPKAERYYRES